MSSNSNKKKKSKGYLVNINKTKRVLSSNIFCDRCNDFLPLYENNNEASVLNGHKARCKGYKVHRAVIESTFESTFEPEPEKYVMDIEQHDTSSNHHAIETFIRCEDESSYNFQVKLCKTYTDENMIKINRQSKQSKAPSVKDTLAIFDFVTESNLSNKQTDNLLKLFDEILIRNNVSELPLPKNHKTIQRQCSDGIISESENSIFRLLRWEYRISKEVFPINHEKCVVAYSYDILQIISETLVNIDPAKFICEPDIRYSSNEDNNRIFEDYTTGDHFKKLSDAIKARNTNNTALCIGLTLDDTQIRSGKRSFTPVYMFILNAIDEAFQMILVGYAPSGLPYNAMTIENDLYMTYEKRKKDGKLKKTGKQKIAENFVKFQERKFQRDYLFDVFKPILESQENGVLLRIGRLDNPKGFEINACIHLTMITGDNLQMEFLTSTSFKSKFKKCRICMSDNCNAIDPQQAIGEFRDDAKMQHIALDYENAIIAECKRTDHKCTNETTRSFEAGKVAGIKAGYNKLIDLFQWQYDKQISGFFKSLVPDYLHTVVKGIIENAIAWTMCCLKAVRDLDTTFAENMRLIDERIMSFPVIQSLVIFPNKPMFRWFKGISELFKSSWRKKGADTTGFFANGSIEAWKLPQLLFQLIFCINENICPFKISWLEKINKTLKYKWNVGRVIINSLVAVLELHFCCRMKVLSGKAITTKLSDMICNARAHMGLLRLLKQDLITNMTEDGGDGGIKHHLLAHIIYYKKWFGADGRITDTELSELKHKEMKIDFERTNKQYSRHLMDMLYAHRIKMHCKYRSSDNSHIQINSDLDDTNDRLYYKIVSTFGKPDNLVVNKNGVIKVQQEGNTASRLDSNGINKLLMSFNQVMHIAQNNDNEDFKKCWRKFKDKNMNCRFAKAISCRHKKDSKTPNDFMIHCNGLYVASTRTVSGKAKNICDFVEVKFIDNDIESTEIARLISIFSFLTTSIESESNSAEEFFLLVCWMKPTRKNSVLPYSAYEYATKNNQLWYQIVSIENVIRPAFLVSHSLNSDLLWEDVNIKEIKQLKSQMFYSTMFCFF